MLIAATLLMTSNQLVAGHATRAKMTATLETILNRAAKSGVGIQASLFAILILIVPILAIAIFAIYQPQIEKNAFVNLTEIARLKSSQIETWLGRIQADGALLSSDPKIVSQINAIFSGKESANKPGYAQVLFERMRSTYG
ncbi:hypothetical protein HQ393_04525 [Chitinibacter bivalviorum]|uniref:Uncharacterized protein n=1 Tax=Chitinibacter bivalviorum TaxID=2739434 RepID=A0A7H9BH47_9NEIS|nr:hypothetical protein [Chitinibacter bivalviorum]QLG87576.1 hypothetical protein HQ393_04525 [Chitinibacter bivalviorum]